MQVYPRPQPKNGRFSKTKTDTKKNKYCFGISARNHTQILFSSKYIQNRYESALIYIFGIELILSIFLEN